MNKNDKKELTKSLESIVDALAHTVNTQERIITITDKITTLIVYIMEMLKFINFILIILIWRVFIWDPANYILGKIIVKYAALSENYKILILGFIGTIIAGIISYIVGSLLLEKIKSILRDNK
jgi:hypothetical protein